MIPLDAGDFVATLTKFSVALGLGGVVVELVRSAFQRKQMGASTAKTFTDAAVVLVGPLQARVSALEAEAGFLRTQVQECLERERHSSSESDSSGSGSSS